MDQNCMEHHEMQETTSFLPVIPRLDRLDRLLQLLEERHSLSRKEFSSTADMEKDDECKDLSSAVEEVHHKGTLIERLSVLENRVLQLSLEMDEGNTSKSSSSTVQVSQGQGTAQQKSGGRRKKAYKKWLGLFRFPVTC